MAMREDGDVFLYASGDPLNKGEIDEAVDKVKDKFEGCIAGGMEELEKIIASKFRNAFTG